MNGRLPEKKYAALHLRYVKHIAKADMLWREISQLIYDRIPEETKLAGSLESKFDFMLYYRTNNGLNYLPESLHDSIAEALEETIKEFPEVNDCGL